MTTPLSAKLAALSVALMVNSMMIIGVAYLFSGRVHETAWLQAQSLTKSTQTQAPAIAGAAV